MGSDNKQPIIVRDLKQAKKLENYDPLDLALWGILNMQAQLSEALHALYLHRNCDRELVAAVTMIQRAGRICHAIRRDMTPYRGGVEFVDSSFDEELAEAFAWSMVAAQGSKGKSLQFLAARYARVILRQMIDQQAPEDADLVPELDPLMDEIAAQEAVSDDDSIENFLRDLEARRVDVGGRTNDLDDPLFDEGDFGGGVGDLSDDGDAGIGDDGA